MRVYVCLGKQDDDDVNSSTLRLASLYNYVLYLEMLTFDVYFVYALAAKFASLKVHTYLLFCLYVVAVVLAYIL